MKNLVSDIGPVKPGTLLLREKPFAYVLTSKEKGQRCDYCLSRGKVLKCSVCQFVHYCGRACQRDAWNDHKWECSNMKRVAPKVLPDAARLLARIVRRLSKGDGTSFRSFYTNTSFRMWKDLMSHYADLKKDKKRMDHFTTLCTVLFEFFKDTSLPNTVEMLGIYGRMCINSFTILDSEMSSVGTGVYLGASVLDHSCRPNAVATFDGPDIHIRATQHMHTLHWDQIRISYIDVMKTAFERQTELLESYYFLCQCDWCLDERQLKLMHAAKCPNSQCDHPVRIPWKKDAKLVIRRDGDADSSSDECGVTLGDDPEEKGEEVIHCEECGAKVTSERADQFRKAMQFTELHLDNMKNASTSFVDVCRQCLSRQEGALHPLNVMRAHTLDHALDALIHTQLWEQACDLAEQLQPCFLNYYGGTHPLTGLLHLKHGKLLLYKVRAREARAQLERARDVLAVTHGHAHPLYREQLLPALRQAVAEST